MAFLAGTELTTNQLLDALQWKFDHEDNQREFNIVTVSLQNETARQDYKKAQLLRQLAISTEISNTLRRQLIPIQIINKLPAEILTSIFSFIQAGIDQRVPVAKYHSWMNVTQVCRRWRQIALGFPLLWCKIMIARTHKSPARLGMLYLERSQTAPITIHLDYVTPSSYHEKVSYTADFMAFKNAILRNRDRLEGIHMGIYDSNRQHPMLDLLSQEWPSLTRISLRYPEILGLQLFHDNVNPPFFGQSPYRLKKLELYDFRPIPLGAFDHLTHLRILQNSMILPLPTLPDSFLDLVSRCPHLMVLSLDQFAPRFDVSRRRYPPISLPHLKRIELWSREVHEKTVLLHNLDMPSDTRIIWSAPPARVAPAISQSEFPFLPPKSYLEAVTDVTILDTSHGCFELCSKDLLVEIPYDLQGDCFPSYSTLPTFFPNIKRISFGSKGNDRNAFLFGDLTVFVPFFAQYSRLETLELTCNFYDLQSLLDMLNRMDEWSSSTSLFPILPRLSSVKVYLDREVEDDFNDIITSQTRPFMGSSYSLAVQRDTRGPFITSKRQYSLSLS